MMKVNDAAFLRSLLKVAALQAYGTSASTPVKQPVSGLALIIALRIVDCRVHAQATAGLLSLWRSHCDAPCLRLNTTFEQYKPLWDYITASQVLFEPDRMPSGLQRWPDRRPSCPALPAA
jgi:hypothetical protein